MPTASNYPTCACELANVTGMDGLALLRSDQVDFAVGSMLDVPHDLAYEPVQWFDPMLILPRDHALAAREDIALEDLSPYGLILPPQRLTTYRLVDLVFQQRKVPYHVAIEVGGWEVIKQYVAMGMGISIVTGICITAADHERLAVRNMRRYFPQRSYGVVVRKGKYLSAQARAFIDLIKPGSVRTSRLLRVGALRALELSDNHGDHFGRGKILVQSGTLCGSPARRIRGVHVSQHRRAYTDVILRRRVIA